MKALNVFKQIAAFKVIYPCRFQRDVLLTKRMSLGQCISFLKEKASFISNFSRLLVGRRDLLPCLHGMPYDVVI